MARGNAQGRHHPAVRQVRGFGSNLGRRPLRRAAFLAAGTAAGLFPARARAQSLTTLRVSGSPDGDIIGTLWGIQSGLFARAGLDVRVTRSNSGPAISAALLGGALDVGKSSVFSLVVAHAKGIPFVLEAPAAIWNAQLPSTALVVASGSPLRTGADLSGKTISVPALGDQFAVAISGWIDQHGGDAATVKFIELPHRAAADAIAAGRIAAAELAPPVLDDALHGGKVQIIGYPDDSIGRLFVSTAYFCAADFARNNVAVLSRFRHALNDATIYANANPDKMVPLLAAFSGIDAKVIAQTKKIKGLGLADQLVGGMLQPVIDAAVKYKSIGAGFPAAAIIDPNATPAG